MFFFQWTNEKLTTYKKPLSTPDLFYLLVPSKTLSNAVGEVKFFAEDSSAIPKKKHRGDGPT